MACPHGTLTRKCEICERDDIIEELREELSLNAKMLSRQTDLAREAEIRVKELELFLTTPVEDPSAPE